MATDSPGDAQSAPMDPSKKIVMKTEDAPCGCRRILYSDNTGQLFPCVPCALVQAGNHQRQAGQLLIAAGERMRQDAGAVLELPPRLRGPHKNGN